MKIVSDYKKNYSHHVIEISNAKYISGYAIKITFNNGTEKLVNFKPFLDKSMHLSIRKYLNQDLFMNFKIINGNLNWNDYDLIFPIDELYAGKVQSVGVTFSYGSTYKS